MIAASRPKRRQSMPSTISAALAWPCAIRGKFRLTSRRQVPRSRVCRFRDAGDLKETAPKASAPSAAAMSLIVECAMTALAANPGAKALARRANLHPCSDHSVPQTRYSAHRRRGDIAGDRPRSTTRSNRQCEQGYGLHVHARFLTARQDTVEIFLRALFLQSQKVIGEVPAGDAPRGASI